MHFDKVNPEASIIAQSSYYLVVSICSRDTLLCTLGFCQRWVREERTAKDRQLLFGDIRRQQFEVEQMIYGAGMNGTNPMMGQRE